MNVYVTFKKRNRKRASVKAAGKVIVPRSSSRDSRGLSVSVFLLHLDDGVGTLLRIREVVFIQGGTVGDSIS